MDPRSNMSSEGGIMWGGLQYSLPRLSCYCMGHDLHRALLGRLTQAAIGLTVLLSLRSTPKSDTGNNHSKDQSLWANVVVKTKSSNKVGLEGDSVSPPTCNTHSSLSPYVTLCHILPFILPSMLAFFCFSVLSDLW